VLAGPLSRIASSAWPFSDRSTPFTKTAIIPHWSASRMNFS
jgi:hypothetical protein